MSGLPGCCYLATSSVRGNEVFPWPWRTCNCRNGSLACRRQASYHHDPRRPVACSISLGDNQYTRPGTWQSLHCGGALSTTKSCGLASSLVLHDPVQGSPNTHTERKPSLQRRLRAVRQSTFDCTHAGHQRPYTARVVYGNRTRCSQDHNLEPNRRAYTTMRCHAHS